MEAEYDKKLKELEEKHAKEIAALTTSSDPSPASADAAEAQDNNQAPAEAADDADKKSAEEEARERKLEKARRKREKQREKERERELQIERENAEAGPSMRQIENEQIEQQLTPLGYQIAEVTPDGNCLYRAVASHCGNTYRDVRKLTCMHACKAWDTVFGNRKLAKNSVFLLKYLWRSHILFVC